MRIAIIADIHGNVAALDAVLADLREQQVDETIVAGDLVNRGPEGAAVLARLVPLGWRTIMGNHEDLVLQFIEGRVDPGWLDDPWWAATRFAAREVAPWRGYLADLPGHLVVQPAGTAPIRVVHGSPRHFMEGIGPLTPTETLDAMLAHVAEPLLACAHTHFAMRRDHAGTTIVNVGAVGLPFNGDPRAQYAILEWAGDQWRVTFRQVAYDRATTEAAYEHSGFLAAGGVSAWLLREELRTARPHLVPFWKYCTDRSLPLDTDSLDLFRAEHDAWRL